MNDKNYHADDYYYNDEEIDNYYSNNQNYYYPNYNNYNNPQYPPVEPKSKKSKGIITGVAIGLLAAASLTGIGVGVYYLINQSDNNNINSTFVNNAQLSETGQYIAERSLSLQFVFNSKNSNSYIVSCGTGWIINKEKNSNIYYVATNLHVAAILTYENQNVWTYEASKGDSDSTTNYGSLAQSLVGYITNYDYQNNTYKFSTITVPKPTIAYITAMDSNWNNLKYGTATRLAYPSYVSSTSKDTSKTNTYSLESDFAILKYDFSNLSSATAEDVNDLNVVKQPNTSADVQNFESWLSTYNNSPTEFLTQAMTYKTMGNNDWEKWKFAMGGFPASTGSDSSDSSDSDSSGSINKNYSNVVWKEFVGFTADSYTSIYANGIGSPSNVQNSNEAASPIVYYGSGNNISSTNTNPWDGGYVNGAYGAMLGASSDPGSSGSMLITQINNQFYVAGIYWGETSWSNSSVYGAADLLNISGAYNLFSLSYNYLTSNGASLYVNPTTNQINS